jgi:PAS domain S-box-containing protein
MHVLTRFAQFLRAPTRDEPRFKLVVLLGALFVLLTFVIDAITPAGYAGGMLYIIPIVLGLWSTSRYVLAITFLGTLLTVVGLYLPAPEPAIVWTAYMNRIGAVFSIWVTAGGVLLFRQVTAQLAESERRNRAIVEGTVEGIVTIDERGRMLSFNRAAEHMFGIPAAEAIGRDVALLMPVKQGHRHQQYVRSYLETGHSQVIGSGRELTGRRRDGTEFPIELTLSEIQRDDGRLFSALIRDVSEAKQARAAREQLLEDLKEKNAELERFTYTVSHDLKSPLITIKGFLGMIERDALAGNLERLRGDLRRIGNAADHMKELLDDLLALSRIGRITHPPADIPLVSLAEEAAALLAGALKERGVELTIGRGLPTVRGDRIRLREALQNLLENAVKFMGTQPAPRIEIGARTAADAQVFYVRDNGVGIDPRYHDKVFGLFEKIDGKSEGSGMGLAIVKRIVEVHGGRIWVESAGLGQGTCFCFTLPAAGQKHTNGEVAA